jgi:hypothetical protein
MKQKNKECEDEERKDVKINQERKNRRKIKERK